MGTIKASENEFPKVLLAEGAAAATPGTGLVVVYAKSDGKVYSKDDAGTETELAAASAALAAHLADTSDAHDASAISVLDSGNHFTATDVEAALAELFSAISGGGIPATTINAKGDLLVGTADDTVARKAVGANETMLIADSGQSDGLLWRTAPIASKVTLSSGNYTGTTGSFADITGASITITTLARRVRVGCTVAAQVGGANDAVGIDVDIDGSRQGGVSGLTGARNANTGHRMNLSFTYLTGVLSAGSHTFKLQSKRISGSSTVTIFADSADCILTFWVEETLMVA